ncbi:MAG: GlxA family transcriptional regulator [Polaromonas sp.]
MNQSFSGELAKPEKIHFLLIPEFSMIALSSILEPLRIANRFGGSLYEWILVGESMEPVHASNGVAIQVSMSIDQVEEATLVFVCSSFNPKCYLSPAIRSWLRKLDRQGVTLGALDTGIYFLSDAGLVGKEKVTLHWEQIPCYLEEYPNASISTELFEVAPHRMYCAGGTAGIDMMLYKIMQEHDQRLALNISEQLLLSRIRTHSEHQRLEISKRHNIFNKRLATAIMHMENNIEAPLSIDVLAASTHISCRQLERLFKSSFNETPTNFYLRLRLNRAKSLLRETDLSIAEISIATGFDLVSYFSRAYRNLFKQTPKSERK